MKKTTKKAAIAFGCAFALIGAVVAVNKTGGYFMNTIAVDECAAGNHSGNHYSEVLGDETHNGHKEFWACCKCYRQYLSNPGGSFQNKTGFVDLEEEHIAYLPKSTEVVVTHTVAGAPSASDSFLLKKETVARAGKTVADLTLDLANTTMDASTPAEIPANGLLDLKYNRTSDLVEAMNYVAPKGYVSEGNKTVWTLDKENTIKSPAYITNLGSNTIEFVPGYGDEDGNCLKMNIVETTTKWYGLLLNSAQETLLSNGGVCSFMVKASKNITLTLNGTSTNINVTTEWQKVLVSSSEAATMLSNKIFGRGRLMVYSTGAVSVYFDDFKVEDIASYGVNHYIAKDASSVPGTVAGYKLYKSETLTGNVGEQTAAVAMSLNGFAAGTISQQTIAKTGTNVDIFYSRDMKVQSFEQEAAAWVDPTKAVAGLVKLSNSADSRVKADATGNMIFFGSFNSNAGSAWVTYYLTDAQVTQCTTSKKISFRIKMENHTNTSDLTYTLIPSSPSGISFSTTSVVSKVSGSGDWTTITVTNFTPDSQKRVQFYINVNQSDGFYLSVDDYIAL